MAEQDATIAEGDEPKEPVSDNSIGRLLALSDGVFAIAMTLLALDLRLPDLGAHPSDAQVRDAIGDDWRGYLAFVISFYVVAIYWGVHRRAMRAVTTIDSRPISHTFRCSANLARRTYRILTARLAAAVVTSGCPADGSPQWRSVATRPTTGPRLSQHRRPDQ